MDKVPPIELNFSTLRELAEKIQELPDEKLDEQVAVYVPPYTSENYYKVDMLIVPTNGEALGSPSLYFNG